MIRARTGLAWALLLTSMGCSDEIIRKSGATCGEGTAEEDGVCVATPRQQTPNLPGTDAGTPDPTNPLKCGAGTEEVEGECVPQAVSAKQHIEGFTITQLSLETRGRVLTGEASDPTLSVHHPIDVTVGVRYEGEPATIPLILALGEADGSNDGDGFCLLGGLAVQHTGHGEVVASQRVFVPEECLKDNSEDGSASDATSRMMNPVVIIDPDDLLDEEGELPSTIVFTKSEQDAAHQAVSAHAAALNNNETPEAVPPAYFSLAQCRRGGTGELGTCAIDLKVQESAGVDFELTDVRLESSVLVLNRCFEDQSALDTYATGKGLPTGYICNRSIVRGLDNNGNPLPEGNEKDYMYGAADVELDTTVTAFGLEHSSVTSADELMNMGTTTADGFRLNVDPEDIVNNALGHSDAYTVRYFLRPASVALVDESQDSSLAAAIARQGGFNTLVTSKKLLPIYLHAQGEQAKGDGDELGGQHPMHLEETVAIPQTPNEYSHGLYVENDCGRFNDPTNRPDTYRPGTPACNPAVNPRDELLYGDYKDETDFYVVACIDGVEGDLPDSDEVDNNCVERPIRVARLVPRKARWAADNPAADPSENPFASDPDEVADPGFTRDELFAAADADGWSLNYDWDNSLGNNNLSLKVHAHTRNSLTLMNGASTDNEAKLTLNSGTFDFSLNLLRVWAQAAARTNVVGSYYDYGLELFGVKRNGERKEAQFHKDWDWNVTKSWSKEKSIFVKIAWVDVGFKAEGQAGFKIDLDVLARDLEECTGAECDGLKTLFADAGANTIGEASVTLTPYGNLKATIFAAISIQVARAGAAGTVTLTELSFPAKAALNWGFVGELQNIEDGELRLAAWANLSLKSTFLKGRLYLFAENRTVEWCKKKIAFVKVKYPCGFGWDQFWDYTIASWNGWTYNQDLWASPTYKGVLSRAGLQLGEVGPSSNTWFSVQAVHSNKCIGGIDRALAQAECIPLPHQRWRFVSEGNDIYRVVNQASNKVLDVKAVSTQNGAEVQAFAYGGGNNQRVRLEKRGDAYLIKFVHSNRCLDINGASQANGAGLIQWDCTGATNQLFRLLE